MEKRLNKLIEKKIIHDFKITQKDSVLVAFSGGPDSVFLLYHLNILSKKYGFKIAAFHLNHCLRGQASEDDALFSRNFSNNLNINFFYEKTDIKKAAKELKISEEEAGRKKRYKLLEKISESNGFNYIATAHHKDDSIEQILMNLIRGTGIDGLSGIPEKRGIIIRPVLDIEKNEILYFLDKNKISYCTDNTNFETDYLRNKVRNILIPCLEKDYNPSIKKQLSNLIDIASEENNFFENFTEKIFEKAVKLEKNKAQINLLIFSELEKAVKRRLLRKTIKKIKNTTLKTTFDHIEKIIEISMAKGSKKIHLKDKTVVQKYFNTLELKILDVNLRTYKEPCLNFNFIIEKTPEKDIRINPDNLIEFHIFIDNENNSPTDNFDEIRLDPLKIKYPLILRNLENGDRFTPVNFKGRKKIKKILSEKKFSPEQKKKTAVLESEGKIYWISGVAKNHFNALPLKGEKTLVIKRILR
jgi:tRNA(Ile)-lysidine synthase